MSALQLQPAAKSLQAQSTQKPPSQSKSPAQLQPGAKALHLQSMQYPS